MSRNRLYTLATAVLAVGGFFVAIIAAAQGELGGVAVLLALAAGGGAVLRIRSRIRSESRHRWALKARVTVLETSLREGQEATGAQLRELETLLDDLKLEVRALQDGAGGESAYTQMALVLDRVLSLEAALHPVR